MTADPVQIHAQLLEGFGAQQAGDLAVARAAYLGVLDLDPAQFDALQLMGVIAAQAGDLEGALPYLRRACGVQPDNAGVHYNIGHILEDLKRYAEAVTSYDAAIAANPAHAVAYNNRGAALSAMAQHDAAIASFDHAIALAPDYVEAYCNRAIALKALGRLEEAVASYQAVVERKLGGTEAHHDAALLWRDLKHPDKALTACDAALAIDPNYAQAYATRGVILAESERYDAAIASYTKALALKPDDAEVYNNRGAAWNALRHTADALADFDRAIALTPNNAEMHYNRGAARNSLARYEDAIADFETALSLNPGHDFLLGMLIMTKLALCDWRGMGRQLQELTERVARGEKAAPALSFLICVDSLKLQHTTAVLWMQTFYPPRDDLGPAPRPLTSGKIRVAYFSMDFRVHPVAFLTANLFEQHDRACFEVYGFSFGTNTGDAIRKRLEGAFDHFIDVREKSDREIAALARQHRIDIAVDLGGYTNDSRPKIFAYRAAPVQVNYLGYPGTMGAPYMDYIIADDVVLPPAARVHYTEKVVTLPDCYQCNDAKQPRPAVGKSRAAYGLPETGFVFCCFNTPAKILPEVFACWMRILKQVENSVLWLFVNRAAAGESLRREAARAGVAPERIVTAPPLPREEHFARHHAADLELDTLPYNAHTTASDALWMGVPLVTCIGESFAARVAASLLQAAGVPELITSTLADYEALAVALGRDPGRIAALKAKLTAERATMPLFDIAAFTHHLEDAFIQMQARAARGEVPDHIIVPSRGGDR